jgi:hypothetical protein
MLYFLLMRGRKKTVGAGKTLCVLVRKSVTWSFEFEKMGMEQTHKHAVLSRILSRRRSVRAFSRLSC